MIDTGKNSMIMREQDSDLSHPSMQFRKEPLPLPAVHTSEGFIQQDHISTGTEESSKKKTFQFPPAQREGISHLLLCQPGL
jgi:hypothetical protein